MSRRFKCFIPSCPNSVSKTQEKVFIHVNNSLKIKWCKQVNINFNSEKRLYCCEDHLNLSEDLDNYYEWKFMKARPRLKSTATLKYSLENIPRPMNTITTSNSIQIDAAAQGDQVKMLEKSTLSKPKALLMLNNESSPTTNTSPPQHGTTDTVEIDSSNSEKILETPTIQNKLKIINMIYKKPKMYLGVPQQYLWVIKKIAEAMSGNELDILIALVKIRMNDSMLRLADEFQLSRATVSKSFHSGLKMLGDYLQNLIFMPNPDIIKNNLPFVFKIRYSNVQCIIDAFEIEIEKPSDPQTQAQTWSQYKHCNTMKYLVGYTPNGFICFISEGYGGRISQQALVEKSDLLERLHPQMAVLADRGFKEIEPLFMTKNIKVLRPPGVYPSNKPSREEVILTKVIASLRVHIERVTRRIRKFRLLKPHSVVNHKHVRYLDIIVLVACGLINMQNEIIKG